MATVMAMQQPLAPRPIAAWQPPTSSNNANAMRFANGNKENTRPSALKQLQASAPPTARARRERPCDGCRRRKSKCVLQDSRRCVLCEFHKQECTFVENAQPRKRKVDYESASANGFLNGKIPPQQQYQPPELAAARRKNSTTTTTTTESSTTVSSPRLQPRPQAHPKANPINPRNPLVVDESLSLQRHAHCSYIGQTTALDTSLLNLSSLNSQNETIPHINGTLRQVTPREFFSIHADASVPNVPTPDDEARALADIDALVGPHGPVLLEIYWRNVHPNYPIIQKKTFMDRHRLGDRQFNPPLLAAMYLLALNWWSSKSELSQHPQPDVQRLEYIAMTSLTVAMQRPKISAVQAGLLLLQRAKSSTWTLTVQLVALGQDIGLHLNCSDWSIPAWEKRLRKRLAWALYMQDKWSALMHGRPSHINAADWAVPGVVDDDFNESIDSSSSPTAPAEVEAEAEDESEEDTAERLKGRTIFTQMIALTAIMAEVCHVFYSQTAQAEYARAGRYSTQLVLARAKPVQIKLKDWYGKLPAACKMDSPVPAGRLSSAGYLHLGYFATEISIHRRIVESLSSNLNPSGGSIESASEEDKYMLYICRSAAKTRLISAMDFVNRLRPAHLDAFWFFASASNFALIGTFGALLMATSPGVEERAFYRARMREFQWTLGVSTRKAGWIGSAGEMVGGCLGMLEEAEGAAAAAAVADVNADEDGEDMDMDMEWVE